jgi:hypothetical protein
VFAVHRTELFTVPQGGNPPVATLDLAPGNYVVTAKFNVYNNDLTVPHQVSATLRRSAWLASPWWDIGWVRLGVRWTGGESYTGSLHAAVELTAAEKGFNLILASTANTEVLASDIWLIAQKVGKATITEVP